MNWNKLKTDLQNTLHTEKHITFLVGAGLSAASGIPTFRGKEGFWEVGSTHYTPEEMGTYEMFCKHPLEVWKWFLYRKTICRNAKPNKGHHIIKEIEDRLGNQFALITQNVDGLHLRAGNSPSNTYNIHGNLNYVRCAKECTTTLYPFPDTICDKNRNDEITTEELKLLHCPKCGELLRPHVLWFDEFYNERYYKYQTVQRIADNTGLLFMIGTSGATSLPAEIIDRVCFFNGTIVDINIENNHLSDFLTTYDNKHIIRDTSNNALTKIKQILSEISI